MGRRVKKSVLKKHSDEIIRRVVTYDDRDTITLILRQYESSR